MGLLSQYGLSPESIYEDSYELNNYQTEYQNAQGYDVQYTNSELNQYYENQPQCSYNNNPNCLYAESYCDQNF